MNRTAILAVAVALAATAASAQDRTFTNATQSQWATIHGYVTKAAEAMPEANYGFKPTPEVRAFGQLVAHIADANFGFCAIASGDKSQAFGNTEKSKTAKADILAALQASIEYCNGAFARMNDQLGREETDLMGSKAPRLSVLTFNNNHVWEHYGNIVTYMRLKGLVPPSSTTTGGRN
jgi:uncharacterized damage-inducible protein DinB